MKMPQTVLWTLLLVALPLAMAHADTPPVPDFDRTALPDSVGDYDGFRSRIFKEGRVYISGQPTEEALRALPDHGVTMVVNLRTPGEMDDRERVSFDEKAVLEELGIEYVWLPQGGEEHPYVPATVASFIEALDGHEGRVLLHCTVGWRASHLWAA